MKENELAFYAELLSDITARIRQGQQRAALSVNAELILTYWDVGRMIAERQSLEGWGAGVIPRLALDLKNDLPEQKGFSERNIGRMIAFFREYPNLPLPVANLSVAEKTTSITAKLAQKSILPPSVAQLENANVIDIVWRSVLLVSWSHNVILIQKIKDLATRIWYARQAAENGWSRDVLTAQIKSDLYDRQGAAVTNFDRTLTNVHAAIANGLLKDPYMFDFLTMEEHFHERELETGLLTHIEKFLLELGRGFAFVGRQYELKISDRDFYLDLLFYHLQLRCFVVVDLKKGEFKPEYAGKMNFYCSAVDDLLRHTHDAPTIGLILCQTKDRIIAEYSLRDIEKPIGVADYELTRALPEKLASSLPSIEDIEAELSQDLDEEPQS